jgi:hypothetical protein
MLVLHALVSGVGVDVLGGGHASTTGFVLPSPLGTLVVVVYIVIVIYARKQFFTHIILLGRIVNGSPFIRDERSLVI